MSIKVSRKNVVPMFHRIVFILDMALYNTNKKLLLAGLSFVGLALIGSLFVQIIDADQIDVGLND